MTGSFLGTVEEMFVGILNFLTMDITTKSLNITTTVPSRAPRSSDIAFASSVILTVLSGSLFVSACAVLNGYYWKRVGRVLVETRIGIVVFFLGALLTTITTLGCYKDIEIYGIYSLFIKVLVGIITMACGVVILFEGQTTDREMDDYAQPLIPIGHTHGSMGIVIWVITLPLCTVEMFFAIGAATKSPAPIYAAIEFVSLTQKLVQASVYHFSLRHRVPKPMMRMGCSWFLKTISLFNFALWIDSIITTPTDNEFVMKLFGNGFFVVKAAYNALIIDYRLLCCLLFLEHALELEDTRHSHIEIPYDPLDEPQHGDHFQASTSVNVEVAHYSGYGYIIGVAFVGLQLVNGLQYLDFVGVWSNVFPVMADIMVVLFGLIMISGNPSQDNGDSKWRDTESKAIDVMVGFMGAVGFVYWVMKACFCFLWSFNSITTPVEESSHPYFVWTSIKDAARSIGMLFQMYFFMKMGPNYCTQPRNISRKIHHLLVPAMMLALLSIFVGCVIDQYNGKVEHLIKHSNIDPALLGFFEGAAPIHLGFTLHMFLHFYIMKRKMDLHENVTNQQQQNVRILPVADVHNTDGCDDGERGEEQPLLSSSGDQSFATST